MNIGVYIHIPFCRQKCLYCDFPSFSHMEHLFDAYTDALCREIAQQGVLYINEAVDTVYIGGGTPSVLPIRNISTIADAVIQHFKILPQAEISMEANPGTVDKQFLREIRALGINRLSLGIQSFHDEILLRLGRIHTAKQGYAAIEDAQTAGFDNINVDLMFGLPEQTLPLFAQDVVRAAQMGVQHISAYGLKIEEQTPFAAMYRQEQLMLPPEEQEEAMYDFVVNELPSRGFTRYEISNYAAANRQCRHNLKYWRYLPYVGLGSSAYSFINGKRLANHSDVQKYVKCISERQSPVCFQEEADPLTAMAEYIFLGLRTVKGVPIQQFYEYFGVSLLSQYQSVLADCRAKELLEINEEYVYLTPRGMKFGNQVFEKFLPD